MEVILKKDIPNLGYENEIVHVKDGYGRNYLIPKGYAVPATGPNRKMVAETQKQKSFKEDRVRKEAETLAKALENITVKIGAKAASTGKIYGSVNAIQIAEAIKEQFNFEVDRKKINIDGDSVKELGTYEAMISLYKDIKVKMNFEVVAD